MKIAIMGAGLTGSYLHRLLSLRGFRADLFDIDKKTKCGISPCAWGTSRGFSGLVADAGLDPEEYIMRRFDRLLMDGIEIQADLMTFDKPGLIRDLLKDTEVKHVEPDLTLYDKIIDATGVARAFLPPIDDDIILPCVQFRMQNHAPIDNQIKLGSIGYAWSFPLSGNEYHVGCGSLISDPRRILAELGWIDDNQSGSTMLCACAGRIRLTSPQHSLPFTHAGRTWGIGEAIGCVAPLAGDGIIPGMKSAQILLECFDDPDKYAKSILSEFQWMRGERGVIDKLRRKARLGVGDALVLKRNSKRMGMRVGLRNSLTLLRHLK